MAKKVLSVVLIILGVFFALLPHSVHTSLGLNFPHVYHVSFGVVAGVIGVYLMMGKKKS
ncbi:MAG: hypothetical protein WAP74_03170 [Patescibacteria group bacterium]